MAVVTGDEIVVDGGFENLVWKGGGKEWLLPWAITGSMINMILDWSYLVCFFRQTK